jgi:hypothetical protein
MYKKLYSITVVPVNSAVQLPGVLGRSGGRDGQGVAGSGRDGGRV